MEEIWKDVEGFEGRYQVSNLGRVRSLLRNGLIRKQKLFGNTDYLHVVLLKDRKYTRLSVHRLVAEHFVEGYKEGYVVNHKDENKLNNNVEKLDAVILANGDNFADALAGSYLAAEKNAPILLIYDSAAVKADVTNYIKANLKEDGKVYVLGVDSGSTSTNAVIMDEKKKIIAHEVIRTGAKSIESAQTILENILNNAKVNANVNALQEENLIPAIFF